MEIADHYFQALVYTGDAHSYIENAISLVCKKKIYLKGIQEALRADDICRLRSAKPDDRHDHWHKYFVV